MWNTVFCMLHRSKLKTGLTMTISLGVISLEKGTLELHNALHIEL